jgi:NHL repeat/6-bladed beta-propeller
MTPLLTVRLRLAMALVCILLLGIIVPAQSTRDTADATPSPRLVLEDRRHMDYVGAITSSRDSGDPQSACDPVIDLLKGRHEGVRLPKGQRSKCDRTVDILAGPPQLEPEVKLVKPRMMTSDSKQRVIITDPGAHVLHVFDFERQKYSRIEGSAFDSKLSRLAGIKAPPLRLPSGVAVDSKDNIYVTDIKLGMVLVYDRNGNFSRYIGNVHGEGFYGRPTAIAIDRNTDRIYVLDTTHHLIVIQDATGTVLKRVGKRGGGNGPAEFRQPTDLVLKGDELIVADAKNSRIQFLDLEGNFRRQFPIVLPDGGMSKGEIAIGVDGQCNIYVVNAMRNAALVYNRNGQLLYSFGQGGRRAGEFNQPTGVWVDSRDFIYIADSNNHRVQIFQLSLPEARPDVRRP